MAESSGNVRDTAEGRAGAERRQTYSRTYSRTYSNFVLRTVLEFGSGGNASVIGGVLRTPWSPQSPAVSPTVGVVRQRTAGSRRRMPPVTEALPRPAEPPVCLSFHAALIKPCRLESTGVDSSRQHSILRRRCCGFCSAVVHGGAPGAYLGRFGAGNAPGELRRGRQSYFLRQPQIRTALP